MNIFEDLSGINELGILDTLDASEVEFIHEKGVEWIHGSSSTNPRTLWLPKTSACPLLTHLLKSRFIPMSPKKLQAWSHTGPFQALLLRKDRPSLESRGLYWLKAYREFGSMVQAGAYDSYILWKWVPVFKPQRAFLICHHSAVLPDLRKQLYFLGIRCEFVWLCDGKEATGDSWPSEFGDFTNSNRLTKDPIGCSDEIASYLRATYDMIITSHCSRYPLHFIASGLPLIHVNSTRFGGGITTAPEEFKILREKISAAIGSGQLRVIHNNMADKWYFEQYISGSNFPVISSLCTSPLRFRIELEDTQLVPSSIKVLTTLSEGGQSTSMILGHQSSYQTVDPGGSTVSYRAVKPFLIWDTRFHIIKKNASKTLREISSSLKEYCVSTSELSIEKKALLDDDMLAGFQAVIHIPYNISTMSCFEQGSANVPIWVPTAELLEQILLDPEEYSELSWYSFDPFKRSTSEWPDQVWNPDVVKEFISRSDFYTGVFKNILYFSSVQDLVKRIHTVNYDAVIKESFQFQTRRRLDVLKQYLEFFKNGR